MTCSPFQDSASWPAASPMSDMSIVIRPFCVRLSITPSPENSKCRSGTSIVPRISKRALPAADVVCAAFTSRSGETSLASSPQPASTARAAATQRRSRRGPTPPLCKRAGSFPRWRDHYPERGALPHAARRPVDTLGLVAAGEEALPVGERRAVVAVAVGVLRDPAATRRVEPVDRREQEDDDHSEEYFCATGHECSFASVTGDAMSVDAP